MKCRHFLSFAFVALLAFFSGLFITTQNSFAIADITYTIDNNNKSTNYTLCSDCSPDFNYIYVEPTKFPISNFNSFYPLHLLLAGRIDYAVPLGGISGVLLDFSDEFPSSVQYTYSSYLNPYFQSLRGTIVVTLSENNPFASSTSPPSGDISITSNGTYDVSSYATATVDVPAEVIQGDYHDDLVSIQKSIIICGAILLVLYFFYCIYRLIIKNSGVK